ncbi:MAG TPA: trypsin-like serine protease [Thermoanaerobaculia bacterium]
MAGKKERSNLKRALEILTEGEQAPIAQALRLEAVEMHEKARPWTMGENIQGLGIANRITQGQKLDELALKVYVERKLPKSQVENLVPAKVDLPGLGASVETDVEEIGKVELEVNTARHRPAMPGCGLAHFEVPVGTFGLLVRKRNDPETLYVLSNSHVLANQGVCQPGDIVLQAGKHDGGLDPGDVLCELAEWIPFHFTDDGFPNLVDAAIAKVRNSAEITSAVAMIGVPKGVSTVVRRGMMVKKCGRTTDLTFGEIKDVDYRLPMSYKTQDGALGRVGLRDQVLCTRYTAPGDSGSAVFNMDGKVVGLHFAGSSSTSIFNKIGNVLEMLGIDVVTEVI